MKKSHGGTPVCLLYGKNHFISYYSTLTVAISYVVKHGTTVTLQP